MLFKLSNLNSNLALTLGYLNPALNNSAQVTIEQVASAQNVQTTSLKISYGNYTNLWTTKTFNLLLLLLSIGKISFLLSSSGS